MSRKTYLINDKKELIELDFQSYKVPEFKEERTKNWVLYGTDKDWKNQYPDYLIHLYNTSSTHNSILNKKVSYIVGQGWQVDSSRLRADTTIEEKVKLQRWINAPNDSENLKELTSKIELDKKLFGGYAVEVILSADRQSIAQLAHIDFSKIRVDKEDAGVFYFTNDWTSRNPDTNEDFETLLQFPWDQDGLEADTRYIIYWKEYRPDLQEYPLPDYMGAIPYIQADADIGSFVAANVAQGFSAGYLVNFYNGEPDEESKAAIDRAFDNAFSGVDQAGKIIKNFSPSKDNGVEILPLSDNGQDNRYINLERTVTNKIFIGHQVPPAAFPSVSEVTGFANNADERRVAIESYQSDFVDAEQMRIEDLINSVVGFNGLPQALEILKTKPIQQAFTEQTLLQILTVDELREQAGYSPREQQSFSKIPDQSKLITDYFERSDVGTSDTELEVMSSRTIDLEDDDKARFSEDDFKFINQASTAILTLLRAGIPVSKIAEIVRIPQERLTEILNELRSEGLIDDDNKVTKEGEREQVTEDEIFVVYKYIERPDAPPLKTESRDFCKRLLTASLTKSFTRDDIDRLRNDFGTDVFRFRGGFYNNPQTGRTTPWCRHTWEQRLVRLKK